jgi:glycosyltransferase involved in cell wall biosynthesis
MNKYDVVRAAEMYGLFPKDVRVVHNPIDYRYQGNIHPLTDKIITDYGLNEADIVAVYPLSTTRMTGGGKQLHKAIKVMAGLKKLGRSVRYVICNAHANGDNEKQEIQKMRALAKEYGLDPRYELIFTSLIDAPKYEHGVPHQVVLELMRFSDLFLFPSVSENCPLVLLEAALGKNLLVLNEDFSPMKDFVGPNALYFKFDSINTVTTHPMGEDVYYEDVAKIINAEFHTNRTFQAFREIKQKFNIDYIFKNELEPLFYERWGGEKESVKGEPVPDQAAVIDAVPEVEPQGMPKVTLEVEEEHGIPGE